MFHGLLSTTKKMVNVLKNLISLLLASVLKLFNKWKYGDVIELPSSVLEALKLTLNQTNYSEFGGFNNETGADHFIVPNIVHYVRFRKKSGTFVQYICMHSAYIIQRPDFIFIHTDVDEFKGKYWNWVTTNWTHNYANWTLDTVSSAYPLKHQTISSDRSFYLFLSSITDRILLVSVFWWSMVASS